MQFNGDQSLKPPGQLLVVLAGGQEVSGSLGSVEESRPTSL